MCKNNNSPDKNEASTRCVRETTQIKTTTTKQTARDVYEKLPA